jgi:hypothetical protein
MYGVCRRRESAGRGIPDSSPGAQETGSIIMRTAIERILSELEKDNRDFHR